MSLASQIESVQPDVYYKLLSEPWFQNIAIFKVREKRLDTEVNRALSGLAGRNGKEQPTVNQGANGTGLSAEQIAVNLAQTFQLVFLGGPMQGFYTAPTFYE